MSRTSNRRQNKRLSEIKMLRQASAETLRRYAGRLLRQWQTEVEFRANNLCDRSGRPALAVWDLSRRKLKIAEELGIEEDLAELCRHALARHMGTGKINLGPSGHFQLRRQVEYVDRVKECKL